MQNISTLRILRNIWRESPRRAIRVAWRHLLVRLGLPIVPPNMDTMIRVPTESPIETAPNGDTLTPTRAWRWNGTGPLVELYARTRDDHER